MAKKKTEIVEDINYPVRAITQDRFVIVFGQNPTLVQVRRTVFLYYLLSWTARDSESVASYLALAQNYEALAKAHVPDFLGIDDLREKVVNIAKKYNRRKHHSYLWKPKTEETD